MSSINELRQGLEQTGEDAARFKWMLVHPESAMSILHCALNECAKSSEFNAQVREEIDAHRRRTQTARPADREGSAP